MAEPPEGLEAFSQQLREADALLIVSPEYKGGIPGALKNAIDLLEPAILRRKPVGICTVSAGGFGGLQCLLQLRSTVLALGGVPIPESIAISRVQERFAEEGGLRNGSKALETERFLGELFFYARALKRARQDAPLAALRQ
jgi:NAD(P)H-dependent FMN reductase